MATRIRLPWTSLDAKSRNTADRLGPKRMDEAVAKAGNGAGISDGSALAIAGAMMISFDFFPPSITKARTIHHAAAVAARHVVEHFHLHPEIKPAWRPKIIKIVPVIWHEATESLAYEANGVVEPKAGSKRKRPDLSQTPGLAEMLGRWDELRKLFDDLVGEFANKALDKPVD